MLEDNEYVDIIKDLLEKDSVNQMKRYRQHFDVSTFEHCLNVSYISYKICKKLKLDYVSMARAALLHDLFLYDWRNHGIHKKITDKHAFTHPKCALENAKKVTSLNEKEEDIILAHMWPVTFKFPKYWESFIITLVDKYSALEEMVKYYKKNSLLSKGDIFFKRLSKVISIIDIEM